MCRCAIYLKQILTEFVQGNIPHKDLPENQWVTNQLVLSPKKPPPKPVKVCKGGGSGSFNSPEKVKE